MEITYTRKGDYLYPNLALDPADQVDIGKYGRMRRRYLREHREAMYWGMFVEGTLTKHLLEKLHIVRSRASARAHSFRCSSSSHEICDFAGALFREALAPFRRSSRFVPVQTVIWLKLISICISLYHNTTFLFKMQAFLL